MGFDIDKIYYSININIIKYFIYVYKRTKTKKQ